MRCLPVPAAALALVPEHLSAALAVLTLALAHRLAAPAVSKPALAPQ
ncbi:hypothetical protein NKJ88_31150 [Mesorhizobium sp. M0016]